jgi:hypothetical protein
MVLVVLCELSDFGSSSSRVRDGVIQRHETGPIEMVEYRSIISIGHCETIMPQR